MPQKLEELMKMRKKFAAIAAVFSIAIGAMIGASMTAQPSADAASLDGPCVVASLKSDPTVKSYRGNCANADKGEVEAPEVETPAVAAPRNWFVFVAGQVGVYDPALAGKTFHMKIVNETTGKVLVDEGATVNEVGRGSVSGVSEMAMQPASEAKPSYLLTISIDGKTYTHRPVFEWSQMDEDEGGDVTTWTSYNSVYLRDGALHEVDENTGW